MSNFYIETNCSDDWKKYLTDPDKQWKDGYSAKSIAECWQKVDGFPKSIKQVFKKTNHPFLTDIEILFAFPEYKVFLDTNRAPSQNDIFIIAKSNSDLIAMTVEGKVSESFSQKVKDWKDSVGKKERLDYLLKELELPYSEKIENTYYQLIHRTASAVIMAKKMNMNYAIMLVHSFSKSNEHFKDYQDFLSLFNKEGKINSVEYIKDVCSIPLYTGWINGI